jgi:hypothetical protein
MRALSGDTHRFRRMSDRPTLGADPLDQQQPAMHGQSSITVRHEDLRGVKT